MTDKKRRLGRALSDMGLQELLTDISQKDAMQVKQVPIEHISANADQPRRTFNQSSLDELASSIEAHGIIQPLVVQKTAQNTYQIIAGERRFRAATQAKLTSLPVIIKDADQLANESIALIENIQREDLNVIDQAEAFARLIENHKMSHEDLATRVAKSRSTISNTIRLNALHVEVKQLVRQGEIDMGHARALLGLPAHLQPQVANQIVAQSLSVRQVEALIARKTAPVKPKERVEHWAEKALADVAIKAKIKGDTNKGQIILTYKNPETLEQIIQQLTEPVLD